MKKQDYLLMSALLLVGLLLYAGVRIFCSTPGSQVEITVDGEVYRTLPLNRDTEIRIPSGNGHTNTLTIRDGYADMTEADCPDKLCVHQKKISRSGETLVCLPHKVVVKVLSSGSSDENVPDGVAY